MSTISNERIEQIMTRCVPFHGECAAPVSVIEVKAMATELLALRKDRERAEPVHDQDMCDHEVFEKGASACLVDIPKDAAEIICRGISAATGCMIDWHYVGGHVHIKALRTAPPAPSADDDSLPYDPQIAEYEQMMEAELKAAARTAYKVKSELSQMAEKLVRDTTALAVTLSAETDTTPQQFESLAGKAVGEDASSMADAHMAWLNTNFPRNAYSDEEWEEVSLYTWLAWRDSQRNACFPGT
ncbi:hypothetical protein PNF79_003080 [Cronobacter dublinensis]|nr:hypothetical protein [Cronobacter dublinensis]